jgi:predicted lipoprotein with Yx(FWY)xxD motif
LQSVVAKAATLALLYLHAVPYSLSIPTQSHSGNQLMKSSEEVNVSICRVTHSKLSRLGLVGVMVVLLLAAIPTWTAAQETGTILSAAFTDDGIPTVVGPDGRTLYWFAHDHDGEPTCYDQCAEEWPPLTVEAGIDVTTSDGVQGTVGTVAREDGSLQVTYNGWPQYYYHEDTGPGQANGQGEGDVWFATPPATVMLSQGADHLVGPGGLTLYVFTQDEANESYCFEECLVAWPALVVPEGMTPIAGEDVTGTLSTIQLEDGSQQVTYEGWPLYFFKGDMKPGEMNGQGLKDVWFVAISDELAAIEPGDDEAMNSAAEVPVETPEASGG